MHRSRGHSPVERDKLQDIVLSSIVAAGLVTLLFGAGYLRGLRLGWDDALGRVLPAAPSAHVVLVAITEEDFQRQDLFAAASPLDPRTLTRLIQRLAAHDPAVVVIDIALDPPAYEPPARRLQRRTLYASVSRLAATRPTHWVLVDPESSNPVAADVETMSAWDGLRLAGNQLPRVHWAAATLTAETGLIRRAPFCATVRSGSTVVPSLLGALVDAAGEPMRCSVDGFDKQAAQRLRFTGGFALAETNTAAGRVLSAAALLAPPAPPQAETILTGKIVILGGTYSASRDTHWTPIGTLYGAQVWAEAADTWWRKDAVYEPSWPIVLVLQAAIGISVGWLRLHFSTVGGHVLAVIGFAALMAVFSLLSFGLGFAVVSALPAFFAAQLNLRIASLPAVVGDYVQGHVARRRGQHKERR